MTAYNAARTIAKYLRETYYFRGTYGDFDKPLVWGRKDVDYYGWGQADAQVCWEGGPYEWVHTITEAIWAGKIDLGDDVHCEPYNGFILSFYTERG